MTKLLTIGLLLLSCGVAEAAERHKPGDTWPKGDGCNTCEMDQFGMSSCTVMYCQQQDIYTDCLHKTPDGKTFDICRMPDLRKILSETQSCEEKMKEAMKTAQKYMYGQQFITPTTEYCDSVCKAERELEQLKQEQADLRKWDAIYQECVK